jgi:hypothetical protein
MRLKARSGWKVKLTAVLAVGLAVGAFAQWEPGQQVFWPMPFGDYFSLTRGPNMVSMADTEAAWHTNGGVSLDLWTSSDVYNIWATNLVVTPEP